VRDGESLNQYLGRFVKHARMARQLTQEELAAAVRTSPSLIGMIETGRRVPKQDTARLLDEVLCTGDLIRDMSKQAHSGLQPGWFQPWPEIEAEACSIRWHEPHLIPGLLQTETYAGAVLASGLLPPERAEEYLATRMARREAVMSRNDLPVCTFIIDEDALHRGSPVILKEQLDDLVAVGERRGIFVHVIPRTVMHIGLSGPFVLASLDGGETVGYVDDQLSGRVTSDAELVAQLERSWQALCAVTLPRDQSRDLILKLVSGP
jgi:transcriptional regulator with XRE-family HTH domain